jgi:alpha-glucosidase
MNELQKTLHSIRLIGIANALRAVRYARRRDQLDAAHLPPISAQTAPQSIGNIVGAEALPNGAKFQFMSGTMTLRFLADDLLFVAWDGAEMQPLYAVEKYDWNTPATTLAQAANAWQLRSETLTVQINQNGGLQIFNPAGVLLRDEAPPERLGEGWRARTALAADAAVYGLGGRAAHLNLRPGRYRLWNTDVGGSWVRGTDPMYICMPLYMQLDATGCSLAFYDNSTDGQITLGDSAEVEFKGGALRYYLAFGTPQSVLSRFTELTGRAPLPPLWALGYQQSQWGYRTEAEMRRIFAEFQRHDLPLSVLTMDADHFDHYRTFTLDEARYPTLPAFAQTLNAAGVHLVASTNPCVQHQRGLAMFESGTREDVFCKTPQGQPMVGVVWPGETVFTDFTHPRARKWWGGQYQNHLARGIEGFWHDMNEPAAFAAWGEATLPLSTRHDLDGRGGDHREAHNLFGLLMDRAGYEGLRALRPEKRPFILSRSGWVGMQRYAWTWTGDIETSWDAMRLSLTYALGLGLCGVPYNGPDIGGFTGHPTLELFVRWFQMAAFLPFFRTHCAYYLPRREPWEFGAEGLAILREMIKLRYKLLPFWYTLAWQTSQTGLPIVRPLWWNAPQDAALWQQDDAFLLGDTLLIAPIFEEGARQRTVKLPVGGWYDFRDDAYYPDAGIVDLNAPLDRIPILVRAGSVLPVVENQHLTLHVYRPTDTGSGVLYSDAGDGYGASRVDRFSVTRAEDAYVFEWSVEGDYGWPYQGLTLHLHGFATQYVSIDGQRQPLQEGRIDVLPLTRVVIGG